MDLSDRWMFKTGLKRHVKIAMDKAIAHVERNPHLDLADVLKADVKMETQRFITQEKLKKQSFGRYKPSINRWMSVDSLADVMPSWSPYTFVFDNPLSFIHPDGRIPYPITIRSFAPFNYFGGGFHGDGSNRGFSTSSIATARVHQRINFDTDKTHLKTNVWSSPSSHRLLPGMITGSPTVSIDNFSIANNADSKTFNFETHSKGSNPYIPGSPNIDVFSNFLITESDGLLNISGDLKGDNFPSTEAFITDPNGNNIFIGVGFYEGSPFSSLDGENTRDIALFSFSITTDNDGNFTGVQYNGTDYGIGDWNKLFKQTDPHKNEQE